MNDKATQETLRRMADAAAEGELYPLSSAQLGVLLEQLLQPERPCYNIGGASVLDGVIDMGAWEAAIARVAQSNDALRVVLQRDEHGVALQRVLPELPLTLPRYDFSDRTDAEPHAWAYVREAFKQPFELWGKPLWQVQWVQVSPTRALFLLRFHHLIADGVSIVVFGQQLVRAYHQLVQGVQAPGEAAPSYLEFVCDEQAYIGSERHQRDREYWLQRIAHGVQPLLSSPQDEPGPRAAPQQLWEIDRQKYQRLQAAAQRMGGSVTQLLLAVVAVYFARVAGQREQAVLGLAMHNRSTPRRWQTIGMFSQVLPVVVSTRSSMTFEASLHELLVQMRTSYRHLRYPQIDLLREMRHGHSERQRLYDITVSVEPFDGDVELDGARVRMVRLHNGYTPVPLALAVCDYEKSQSVQVQFSHDPQVLNAQQVQATIRRLHHLLNAVIAAPETAIGTLPLMTPDEAEQLAGFNRTQQSYPGGCIHQLFEAQAARAPDAVALEYEGQQLSYGKLEARANQLARHLKKLGVGADQRVAIALPRSLELVVALLGTLKAGGAYVPLDPAYPAERLRYMLQDSEPVVMLSTEALARSLLLQGPALCCVDAPQPSWAEEPETALGEPVNAHDAAYVIYTSGSTGQPKGVVNAHKAVVNRLRWMQQAYELGAQEVVLQKTPASFDVSVWEFFWPLMCGARLVLARPEGHRDPHYLVDLIERSSITTLHFVPSMINAFLQALPEHSGQSLRRIMFSGEALPASAVQAVRTQLPWAELHNLYGPTEAAVDVTAWRCTGHEMTNVPIGRPIANTRIHILDEQGQEVPIGVPGEIYIGGVQVARGYLRRPGLTAQRFVADPYSGEPGARMYRTGDLGRWREDGSIEYLGRNDHQVKIRGLRIELGEIEAALQACDGVREAVVLARGQDADKQLVAYITGDAGGAQVLREALAVRLPAYMVPAAYVQLDTLPLTPSGKLDRQALPDPQTSAYGPALYEAPQGEVEPALAETWSDLLGVPQVGRHDNFFELGGHSLLAVQLMERMRRLHWELPVRALFASPTLAALAQEVRRHATVEVPANRITAHTERITPELLPLAQLTQSEIDQVVATVEGGTANVQDIYALTPLQQGMVFHHLMQQRGDAYLTATMLAFDSPQRLQRYLQALQSVIQRHDILRTALVWKGLREPVQVVWRHAVLPVQELDIQANDVAAELKARLAPQHTRIELDRTPLLRAHLAHDAKRGRWLLHLLYHHTVMDHTTLELVVEELQACMGGHEHLLPEPVPFRNFVAQARAVSDEAHEQYFREQLDGVREPTAPYGLMDIQGDGSQVLEEHVPLPPALAQAIRRQSRLRGVSAASVFHLAWALVVARTSGRRDVVFGTVLFGRLQGGQGAQRAVGMFMNTLPLRVRLDGRSASQALQHTHDALACLLQHEHASLAQAQRASAVPHPAPLFTALLNYRYAGGSEQLAGQLEDDELQGVELLHAQERTNYPVGLSVNDEQGGGFSLDVQVNPPVAPQQLARHMMHALRQIVQALQSDAHTPLVALPALPEEEAQQVAGFNRTQQSYPSGCIHELFERQAQQTPEAVALEYEGQQLSYGQLEGRANQLARHLKKLGVGADQRVAIALPRSLELVVALLGTLKAGGAYVPMDPAYPIDRLRHMLQDSEPLVVVCTEALAQSLPLQGQALCCLDQPQPPWAEEPETAPGEPVRPRDAAYVIYTSGSTGRPKGVVVEHRSVVNYCAAIAEQYGLTRTDRILHSSSISFDIAVEEIFGAMSTGAALVLPPWERLPGIEEFERLIERRGLSVLSLPTAYWHEWVAAREELALSSVRLVVVGGESVSAHRLQQWHERASARTKWLNSYGPTETTVCVSFAEIPPGERVHIGRPIPNTRIHILDEQGQELPVGVAGEIHIGGVQVARGYLRRPDLTAERFVPDPFGEPGSRMYKTGDLGRWLADGTIEFLGRNDHQVKIRGFRIEPGEIEAALRLHPEVREAVVLARDDGPGGKRLVAYVIGDAAPEALRTHLGSCLPEYMIPAAYVALDTLPLTPNGKLDRKALPAPDGSAYGAPAHEAPQGEIETTLALIWSELLGIERVGRHDDFFALGGHSLLAVQLSSRIRATLGLEVPLAQLFAQPTLAGYAQRVAAATGSVLPAIVPVPRQEQLPLSFSQQRLWFLAQFDERADAAYAIPAGVRLKGSLDGDALQAALNRIVARHEVLRTCFTSVDGTPMQLIAPPEVGLALWQVDLSEHSDPEAELERLAAEEASAPFDLARGALFRARLIRLADDDHALLVTMHHIVSDGWSMGVLVNEFSALYAAFSQGQPDPLPPLPIQYADYAVWQRRWIAGEVLQRQLDFWRSHLSGAPALLELPTDRPRPAVQDYAGASFGFELNADLTANLKALSQRHGTTMFMTLLASWAALLSRLSGQSDVVIGTPVANRHRAEVEPLIGFFVNTQALRIDLSGSPTVAQLLAQVRAIAVAAQEHQDVPFEQVVEALAPQRSRAHSPVFQVMFAWQNAAEGNLQLPGLQLQPVGAHVATIKFDLELSLQHAGDCIAGHIGYACGLFERTTVERHIVHWQTLLRALVTDDQAIVARLPLLSDDEQHQLLQGFNDTAASFPLERCIHELFEAQVERTPEATALVFEDTSLSYAELNAHANRLAHHLIALGVQPDTRVAIALPRGIDMVVALLATLKAAGAYVPLDPDYPAERLAFMLDDSDPCVLITGVRVRAALGDLPHTLAVLALDDTARPWQVWPAANPEARLLGPTSAHLAYVIYTSGSTGQPKGAMNEHRAVVNRLWWMQQAYGLDATDAVLQKTPFGFDVSVWEFFWPWLVGARLVLARPQGQRDPAYLLELIDRERITTLHFVPSMLSAFLAGVPAGGATSLRRIVCSGEALPASMVEAVHRQLPQARLFNLYGPTEAAVDVTAAEPLPGEAVTLGRPIANTSIYILDPEGAPVPLGAPGEIHIGGVQVGRGYLDQPGLTAERFVPNPYSSEPGARMYKTGDLGRWRADGTIEFLGRRDDQVKLRGFRIELGEIEARLRQHPGVRDVVVLAREDAPGDKRLVAYVVGEVPAEALRGHLAAHLPEYMVPAAYVRLDALPLTPNGKLDRRALPAPEAGALTQSPYIAPQGETERAVAAIWSQLLAVPIEHIGREADFFALGGHSLLAVQLTSRIRAALGLEVPLAELFAQPTLTGFAERVAAATASALPAIVPAPRQEALPLSFAQQRLWFLAQLDERAAAAYAMPGGLRLRGALNVVALHDALNRIVARHEALRTSFASVDGEPTQVISAPDVGFALARMDLSDHADPENELEHLAAEEAAVPFDLAHGPLIRARLIRLADDDHALLVTMHHIVSDGWSMGVLINEFSALYAAFSQGQPDPLPALPIQYADYAVWQRRWITGEVLQRQLDFWRDHLSGAPALLELPTDRPRPPVQDYAGASFGFELDAELSANLKALSQRHGTTLFMTLLASWAALLARLSGQSDVVIGTPVANRHRAEIEPLIGFFVNTQALRVDLSGLPTVAQLLAQVRATALAAQEHQDIPFEQVVETLSLERSLAHAPLYQVVFAMQNTPTGELQLPGLSLEGVSPGASSATTDLWWSVEEAGERLTCTVVYARALFDAATIERWSQMWRTLARHMCAGDEQPLSQLPLLEPAEHARLVHGFNATTTSWPARCIHQLFEEQARSTPHAEALVCVGNALSYQALNARANRLAHHLIALGVRPDSLVAIALPRGIDMVVALLATLKAGGTYVPLDPDYPAERLGYMLDDCKARWVLTDTATQACLPASRALMTATVLELNASHKPWNACPDTNPDPAVLGLTPSHLAYVIYTSGSTGRPKGTMVAHAGLCNLALAQIDGFAVTPASRVLQFASFSFDACISEVLMALCSGATLHVPAPGVLVGPALHDVLRNGHITHVTLPPAVLAGLPDEALPELQTLVMAGEAASHALVQRWATGRRLLNAYGPTEATVCASMHRCDTQHPGSPPIGSSIANTRIYILDAQGQPSPVGVAGEICIAGIQVARGYLRRPDLTAERFVPDPFGEPGSRMYKTGDLGRWRPDGTIEFLGRNDHQVKVRGFRIELSEIEAALRSHPEVRAAAVLAREDAAGDKRLVAYIISSAAPEALRQHLGSRLPEFMVPAAYVSLDALPLTPNGKLDHRALPAPEGDAFDARAYEAPQGEIETLLADLWKELLGIERIGRHDNFFALGGHSLLAVQLTSRVRAALGLDVPLAELFAQPTLAAFAQRVAAATASVLPAIVRNSRLEAPPLSFAQQRLWFLTQLDERAGAAYAIPGGVRLKGSLDAAALQAAMNRIVARHEALRTSFGLFDGAPVQIIAPPEVGLALSEVDLSAHPHLEAELEHLAAEEASAPFDLVRGPLIRGRLIRLADDDHTLLVTMHHIVSDGWSMGVLVNEFSALYAAFSQGRPDPLPGLPIQYADYAVWQRHWITGEVLQRQLDFWRNHLSGAPVLLELPTDRPRPAMQDYAGASLAFELDAELTANLKALSQRHGTTLFMTLLASWAALLARLSGQSDVVIGTPVANRHRAEIEPLIGFFVNTQALRVDLSGSPTVAQLLARVRATALAAQEHQDIPFEQVVEALSPMRSMAHSPIFQVMFAWQNAPEGSLDLPGLQLEPVGLSSTTAKFDLELTLHDAGERLAGSLGHACALFDRSTIERHLSHWQTLLRALVAHDDALVARLPLLTEPEQQYLLHGFNDTAAAFPHERCIHQLFEQQAARTPDATALLFESASLTYRELNAQANRIAHHLVTLGVRAGDCVALALPRSDELVAAELAVLKCGAAYVPLDLDHPSERLHFMLADCAARVLVCDSHCSLLGLTRLELDRLADPGACTNPQRPVHPQAGAYVMYTSGSTGTPKGVVVPHRAVVNLALQQRLDLCAEDRFAFASNPAFDSATLEVWGALLHGATIVVVPQAVLLDPVALADHLQRYRISQLVLVAGVLRSYAPILKGQLSTLRQLITGGDMADPQALATVLGAGGAQQVLQTYGPTETTQFVTTLALREAPSGGSSIPIGSPIANARIYILDAHGQPTPLGVAGEIHIAGAGVAQGYLRRPDLTAERFVPDPYGEPGSRMYKTGDLGRWGPDGTIEFLGRNDHQVKIRGFRIELGEIEAALCLHPEVRDAVVLAREDAPGDKRLVAYVVGEAAPEALREHLNSRLPEYMVPAAYVSLDALPLTPNGKLDRRALPDPEADAFGSRAYKAPQGEVETLLAHLWSQLLGIERIGRHDDFFALGGHSLRAVQVTSRVRAALGVDVPLAELFAQSTLASFAQRVAAATASALPAIVPASRLEALPLSFAQQRLWFLAQLNERAGAAYVMPGGVRLKGSLDVAALHAAMNRIVERHEVLRTCFGSVDGAPVQVIAPPEMGLALSHADLSSDADSEAWLERLAVEEASAPFDLTHGPLIRARLIRLADNDHALLVTMHHIVSDGWSMGVLVNEFSALYAAFSQGLPDPLQPLPIQYADYAMWQRRWITGEVLQRQLDFWRDHLRGAPALLELPTDRPRPAIQDYTGASFGFTVDAELTAKLKALSQRHGTTLFMTLLASWAALLARLSGHSDVVIGTPVANRHRAEIEPLIGFFVNTQALRIDLSGSPSVAELLAQVRATALAAQQHPDVPFEQVVEALSPVRSLAHSPVFQVMFAWQSAPEGRFKLPDLQLEPIGADVATIKFDLELSLQEAGNSIAGHVRYACALFDLTTVERHVAHWQTLLRALVADDDAIVARLPLLSADQQYQMLHGVNDTAVPFPAERCIHELFEAQVARTPEATALVGDDTSLSYAELNVQANRLAHHLIALGVQPDTRVAIALPRGIDLVVALLATLKAGGAYVPLDADYPAERLALMLADSAPRVLITHSGMQPTWGALPPSLTVLSLDTPARPWNTWPATNPEARAQGLTSSHLAYVIYTSGSTGTPKGVMVAHQAVVKLVMNNGYARFDACDRVAFAANPAFDASTLEVWAPLLHGGALVVIDQDVLLDAPRFALALQRHAVSVLWLTVGLFNQYAQALSGVFTQLRYLIVGGDALDPQAIAQVLRNNPPQHLLNGYGPTETTTFAIMHEVHEVPPGARGIPLGRPISNTRIYVLDAHGAPVPLGVPGEIHIGGLGAARGYLQRPDLTAERFIPDPFADAPGARMYKSGDLGRWLADGTIEFFGRNDHQVKIRGFRIEPGEIEAALRSHPEVREAVVLARENTPGDKRLVAYVVGEAAPEALRAHLGSRLPEYMVPAAYVVLDKLPLTPNGKLDRRALPAPEADAFGARAYEAPQGEIEILLAHLWSELLGIERIGRHDNFFALGGHSLLAVQLISRIRTALGVEVPLAELFAQPTLAGYAVHVCAATASVLPAIVPASRHEALPLSFAQQRLWFLAQLDERAGAAYAIPGGVRLKGVIDVVALQLALNRIVARHEALRTCFGAIDGTPVQLIAAPEVGLALTQADLSGHSDPEAELERLAAEEARAPFDLIRGPLIRGRLIRLADDDHVLLVTMHHIVSDGWSMGVLINEFSALYEAYSQGRPDSLPALPIQYADYAVWQRRWITGEVLQRQLDFWRDHLCGAPALLELPTDRPRPAVQDYAGASCSFELDAELSANLKVLSQRHGTTLFMTLLASWAALLARLSGQSDVVIGTPVANRHRAEIEPLIGFFVNTQALRVDLSRSPSVAELLAQVRATALAAQAHQDVPFEQVVEALSPIRSMAHSPVFQVMFAWQNAPDGSLNLPGLQLEPVALSSTTAKFDLVLTVQDASERIVGGLKYACALFDHASIERDLGHWQTLLRALVANDGACVVRLPLLSLAEQQHLLHAFNDTASSFPHDRCIHQLFEEQVDCTPEATALVSEDTSLSYRELNALANRMAHHLTAVGVRPDSRVAIALPRGIDMVVALLATLKAGGAYVPLDPDYPRERLAYMLADSAPRALITQSGVRAVLGDLPASLAVLTLDVEPHPWLALPTANPEPNTLGLSPAHLAYVIYTSGSTGLPKGVMVAHRNVVHLWAALERGIYAHHPGIERVSLNASLAFDASVKQWVQLASGRTLVIVPNAARRDAGALVDLIATRRIDAFDCTPSQLQLIHSARASAAWRAPTLALVGGEAIDPALWATLAGSPDTRYYNVYGPTECTVDSTIALIQTPAVAPHIGRPVANARIYILDRFGAPVAVGMPGEVYIGGAGVAHGYLRRPDLTAERFVPDPFGEPGSRMYKTGDLGRWRPEGTIEFLGRNDHQVKIRGFRIELSEIEAALRSHPQAREAVVLAREDAPGDKRLVAYVVGEAAPEALRAHLGSRLPEYMVPVAYVALDTLPLTPNGKLDRAALPAPDDSAGRPNQYEPPHIGLEQVLAKAWSRVLNVTLISREDHFFELGGHSLLAVRLVAEAQQRGLGLTLQDVYACPTLRAQAERLLGAQHSSGSRALTVRRTGTAPTLFAVPTGMGDVIYAFELAAHMDVDAPIYAIPWPDVMPESMDDLAAYTVQVMRTVQPAGPYRLVGYSSGALLAYAIAQLLAEQDETVDFIGMLDCVHQTTDFYAESPEEMARQWLLHEITRLMDEQTFGEQGDVRQALQQLADDVPGTPLDELIARYEDHDVVGALAKKRHSSVRQIATTYLRAARFNKLWFSHAARALPAPLKLHVFYATERKAPPHPMGWQELLPLDQIVVVPIPGTHTSMMEPPHIGHVGRAVSEGLLQRRSVTASLTVPSSQ